MRNILISGAGIAGPTLAYWLATTGARITVVEKAPSLLPHGQNVDIRGCAIGVIKKMGLLEEVKRNNTKEKGTQFIDPKGRAFGLLPIKEGSIASFTSEFEILRGDLAKILYEHTKDHPNITYLFGTTIEKVVSNNDNTVKVVLSNGEVRDFGLLVAADGQWSKVRKQTFPPESLTVIDFGLYVAYWTAPRLPGDNDFWNVYQALRSRVITLRPDPYDTIRVMFTLMPCNNAQKAAWQVASKADRQTQEELIRREFADAGWQAPRLLESMGSAPDFYFQAIKQIKLSKWHNCRVVCLGDTAYAPTPITGGGTTLAIIGAYVLAGELSKLNNDDAEHPSKALEAYETAFRPFVEQTQRVPWFAPGIVHPETRWKRWVFQITAWALSKVVARVLATPWLAKRFDKSGESNNEGFSLPLYPNLGAHKDVKTSSISTSTF